MMEPISGTELFVLACLAGATDPINAVNVRARVQAACRPSSQMSIYSALNGLVRRHLCRSIAVAQRDAKGGRSHAAYVITPAGKEAVLEAIGCLETLAGWRP